MGHPSHGAVGHPFPTPFLPYVVRARAHAARAVGRIFRRPDRSTHTGRHVGGPGDSHSPEEIKERGASGLGTQDIVS